MLKCLEWYQYSNTDCTLSSIFSWKQSFDKSWQSLIEWILINVMPFLLQNMGMKTGKIKSNSGYSGYNPDKFVSQAGLLPPPCCERFIQFLLVVHIPVGSVGAALVIIFGVDLVQQNGFHSQVQYILSIEVALLSVGTIILLSMILIRICFRKKYGEKAMKRRTNPNSIYTIGTENFTWTWRMFQSGQKQAKTMTSLNFSRIILTVCSLQIEDFHNFCLNFRTSFS